MFTLIDDIQTKFSDFVKDEVDEIIIVYFFKWYYSIYHIVFYLQPHPIGPEYQLNSG
jgi:hypothetical protein